MKELAPQTKDGSYSRPTYNLKGVLGSSEFPVGPPLQQHSPTFASQCLSCRLPDKHAAPVPGSSGKRLTITYLSIQLAVRLLFF